MTIEVNMKVASINGYKVVKGKTGASGHKPTRIAYERKNQSINRSFFPAAPFDAQSLAGTGALVFEGEMVGGGN